MLREAGKTAKGIQSAGVELMHFDALAVFFLEGAQPVPILGCDGEGKDMEDEVSPWIVFDDGCDGDAHAAVIPGVHAKSDMDRVCAVRGRREGY